VSVRIKRPAHASPPPELLTLAPARREGDPWAATRAHEAWCAARAAWVAAGGAWPGGEGQREVQEAISTPDEPWDESLI
jgi:hypothetical protein